MGLTEVDVKRKLSDAFNEEQATVLATVVVEAYTDLVKTSDFNDSPYAVEDLTKW